MSWRTANSSEERHFTATRGCVGIGEGDSIGGTEGTGGVNWGRLERRKSMNLSSCNFASATTCGNDMGCSEA